MVGTAHLVIAGIGQDRPGLVDSLSQFLLERGANIEESRMAVLGGEFGVMLLVSVAESAVESTERDVAALAESTGLQVIVKRTTDPGTRILSEAVAYRLTATSLDHPGIVSTLSRALAQRGVNIERAECVARPGPWSGAPVFHLEMDLAVPDQAQVAAIREALAQIGSDEGIDIEMRAARA